MDTTDAWIVERTGIRERHVVEPGVGPADLALEATKQALEEAGWQPQDIEFIIFATLSPEMPAPGSACLLQEKLGIAPVGALDIRTQCSGFVYGLSIADAFIRSGMYRRVLLVASEVQSPFLDMSTRGRDTAVLFGDGAGVALLEAAEEPGVLSTHLHADGRYARELCIQSPSSLDHPPICPERMQQGKHYPYMNGREVFKTAVATFPKAVKEALAHNGHGLEDLDLLILHQANARIVEAVARFLRLPPGKMFNNIEKYGNTTAASIPIALDEARKAGRVRDGALVCLAAFGAGFTWGSALIRC